MANIEDVYAYLDENEPDIAKSICYASEMLLSQLELAIQALKERRIAAVTVDDDIECELLKNYRDMLKEYKTEVNSYLNYATKQEIGSKKEHTLKQFLPGFEGDEKTTHDEMYKQKIDYKKYTVDSSKPYTLNENFTHKKICSFMFRNIKYTVNDWTDALTTFCNLLSEEYKKSFKPLVNLPVFQGRKVSYFSYNYVKDRNVKIKGSNVYVWTNLSANAIVNFIKNILIEFNENPGDFYIYLKADYTELHSNEKAQTNLPKRELANEDKIGKHIKKCMRELETKQFNFPLHELEALLDLHQSKAIFGINVPFFMDNNDMDYDTYLSKYWKESFTFNGKKYYITSQWYERNRERFDAWYDKINRNVR